MTNSKPTGVESYIKIVCSDNADPKYNMLQLGTDPPTFIELQPGVNILSVEEYPDLKYGFRQIDNHYLENASDATNEYNCGDVLLVDLSHFDSSEMTSMDMMFCKMENLENIVFGDIRIENVTSMNSAFEWIAVNDLNLTNIDFSKVSNAEMMTYSQGTQKVNLTGCDLSKITEAEGIFNGVSRLILDGAQLSDAVIKAMDWEEEFGCEDVKEISMKGCDIRMIRSVMKALLNNTTDGCTSAEIILDKESENEILYSYGPLYQWQSQFRKAWYLNMTYGSLDQDNEITQLIIKYLRKNNLIEPIKYSRSAVYPRQSVNRYLGGTVYCTGWTFPVTLIKTFFNWKLAMGCARHSKAPTKAYSFVVGNYYAAFSDNPDLKFYVPILHSGYITIEDALMALVESGYNDLSNCRIIEIQYLDPKSIPEVLHYSSKWSPFTDGKFNLPAKWEEKFKIILSKRKNKHQSNIDHCLTKLSRTKFNHGEVCTDTDGNRHLIYPSKIIKISPHIKDDKVFATVFFEGHLSLTVDLLIFTKELTGHQPWESSNITDKKASPGVTEIQVPPTDLTEVYKSIEEECIPIWEKHKKESEEISSSSDSDDSDDVFVPEFDDDDDVFQPEDDEEGNE